MSLGFISTLALATALATALPAGAQNPGLQHRPAGAPADQSVKVTLEGGKAVLPDDAFGLYRYADRPGEFGEGLQINQQFGEVNGYLTVAAGRGKLATYFLSEVTGGDATGNGHFAFATRQVHGVWYSFDGKVVRGAAPTAAEDGYYQMDGTLTMHDDQKKTAQDKKIALKLTAMH